MQAVLDCHLQKLDKDLEAGNHTDEIQKGFFHRQLLVP